MTAGGRTSKLALGTAQFGMRYGIANEIGQTPASEACKILRAATKAGISLIDTAHSYGDAEAVFGQCRQERDAFRIVTKIPPLRTPTITGQDIGRVSAAFNESLLRLGRDRLYGLLVHDANDLLTAGGEDIWSWLVSLREARRVEKIGVSVYSPEQLQRVLERYDTVQIVQLPFNIYDQRFARSGLLDRLKEKGIETHSRSTFLQGLLLMPPERLPERFSKIRDHHKALHTWLRGQELGPLSGALSVCLGDPRIDYAVVACETLQQFDEILVAAKSQPPLEGIEAFAITDEMIINPNTWSVLY